VPDYCIREVSDHAMALLLALIRKVPFSNTIVQSGRWEMPAVVPIRRIEGTMLGLLGFGNIPRLLAPKAKAFGMQVVAYDPFAKPELFVQTGVERVELDDLFARADYVSVHAPLTPQTRGMLNAGAFAKMKRGVYVVNTARGPLIDENALIAALDSGQVGAAALDVVTAEPLAKESRLLGRDNVIVTPHTAFYSIEALDELQSKCASDVARVLRGEKAVYPISA
jgi:D-3-phosphoglycerate dehydrogenase